MVDRFKAEVECSYVEERHLRFVGVFHSSYGAKVYKYELPNLFRNESLYISKRADKDSFYLNGNLRKWYFGKEYPLKDLTYFDFIKALVLISKRLDVSFRTLIKAKLRYVELGANLTLAKPFEVFIQGFYDYPNLTKERTSYKKNSVTFGSSGNQIIIYDKIAEILKKGRNPKLKKLNQKIVVIRVEKKRSNNSKSLDERINSFSSVIQNWNKLLDEWRAFFDEVKINPMVEHLPVIKEKSLYKTDFINLLLSRYIHMIGNEGLYDMSKRYCIPKKRSEYERYLLEICEAYQSSKFTYEKLKLRADHKRLRLRKRNNYLN